jgi:K+-sensing histidine kinase KdpD
MGLLIVEDETRIAELIQGALARVGFALDAVARCADARTALAVTSYDAAIVDLGLPDTREQRDRVFERFWRGKGTGSAGAGLDLAIVAEIMKAHQGSVSVDDNPGGGMIFTLRFGLAMSPAE